MLFRKNAFSSAISKMTQMNAVCAQLLNEPKMSQSYSFQLRVTSPPRHHLDGENCSINRFARPRGVGMLGKSTQLYSRALSHLLIFIPIHLCVT